MSPQVSSEFPSVFFVFMALYLFVALVFIVITALVYCKIFSKAGFSWALGLLMLVPIANIVMFFYLAFADWPVHRELRQLRQQLGGTPM